MHSKNPLIFKLLRFAQNFEFLTTTLEIFHCGNEASNVRDTLEMIGAPWEEAKKNTLLFQCVLQTQKKIKKEKRRRAENENIEVANENVDI